MQQGGGGGAAEGVQQGGSAAEERSSGIKYMQCGTMMGCSSWMQWWCRQWWGTVVGGAVGGVQTVVGYSSGGYSGGGCRQWWGAAVRGADLWHGKGSNIQYFHQGVCQVTEASHLAVFPDLGLGQALPLSLTESQGWQVDHHMLPFMDASPVPAIHQGCIAD